MQHVVTTLAVASVAAAHLLVTRQVSDTAGLKAAMADNTVGDIEMAAGVYRLADEPGLGCSAPAGTPYAMCIQRGVYASHAALVLRAAAGAKVVLDGGGSMGVVFVENSGTVLQGLEITNGGVHTGFQGGGIYMRGILTLDGCSVYGNIATVMLPSRSSCPAPATLAPSASLRPAVWRRHLE